MDALSRLRRMFLVPTREGSGAKEQLSLNRNTIALVRDVFSDSEAYRRMDRFLKAAKGELRPRRTEDRQVAVLLRRTTLLVRQFKSAEAESELESAIERFPGRDDIVAMLAWVQKSMGDCASARDNFRRAHELGCDQRDAYWHWSDLEATAEEWSAAAKAAEMGIERCGRDKGLLYRLGYALHRQGKELLIDGEDGSKLCRRAAGILEDARTAPQHNSKNFSLSRQIYRAIALNLEALDDGPTLALHMSKWQSECPNDQYFISEYDRLRQKFPQYLRAH